jgi:hypothetical protein
MYEDYDTHTDPHPEPVDGDALLHELVAAWQCYIVLPPGAAELLTLWAVTTHCLRRARFTHAPRLFITAASPDSGKSVLTAILAHLSHAPKTGTGMSDATFYRMVDETGCTLFISEADRLLSRGSTSPILRCLNSGHYRPEAWERKQEYDKATQTLVTVRYSTFAFVCLNGIGQKWIDPALRSRGWVIQMQRKMPGDAIDYFDVNDRAPALRILRAKIMRWCADHMTTIGAARPVIENMINRAADNARPLLAIADTIGGEWPVRARAAIRRLTPASTDDDPVALLLYRIAETLADPDDPPKLHKIGADGPDDPGRIASADLTARLRARDDWPEYERMTPHGLAAMFRDHGLGIAPRRSQFGGRGSSNPSSYWLRDFRAPLARYGIAWPEIGEKVAAVSATGDRRHYWLMPPPKMAELRDEFNFDRDVCPHPRPDGFDALAPDYRWGKRNWCNPLFTGGVLAWVKRAIEEQQRGNLVVLILPLYQTRAISTLTAAGAEVRLYNVGRWLAIEDGLPAPDDSHSMCTLFILRPPAEDIPEVAPVTETPQTDISEVKIDDPPAAMRERRKRRLVRKTTAGYVDANRVTATHWERWKEKPDGQPIPGTVRYTPLSERRK